MFVLLIPAIPASFPSFLFITLILNSHLPHFLLHSFHYRIAPIICRGYRSARSFDSYDYLSLYFHIFLHFYSFHLYKVLTFLICFISIHLYSFHNRITTHYLWWLQKCSLCRFLRLSEPSFTSIP